MGASYAKKLNYDGPCSGSLINFFSHILARNEEDVRVLNDQWVCTATEDVVFHSRIKSEFEENVFLVEDQRFELDLGIEKCISVIKALQIAEEKIEKESTSPPDILSHLSIIHRQSIVNLYGGSGHQLIKHLFENPKVVIPLVINRFIQKKQELQNFKDLKYAEWRRIIEENYSKLLSIDSVKASVKFILEEADDCFDENVNRIFYHFCLLKSILRYFYCYC